MAGGRACEAPAGTGWDAGASLRLGALGSQANPDHPGPPPGRRTDRPCAAPFLGSRDERILVLRSHLQTTSESRRSCRARQGRTVPHVSIRGAVGVPGLLGRRRAGGPGPAGVESVFHEPVRRRTTSACSARASGSPTPRPPSTSGSSTTSPPRPCPASRSSLNWRAPSGRP